MTPRHLWEEPRKEKMILTCSVYFLSSKLFTSVPENQSVKVE